MMGGVAPDRAMLAVAQHVAAAGHPARCARGAGQGSVGS
jgi:hypothetical protein